MNTKPRRPPSEVSRLRTSAERLREPNEASVAEPLRLPSEATCTSAELPSRLKEARVELSPPNEASAAEPLRPLSDAKCTNAEPPSEASTEPPRPLGPLADGARAETSGAQDEADGAADVTRTHAEVDGTVSATRSDADADADGIAKYAKGGDDAEGDGAARGAAAVSMMTPLRSPSDATCTSAELLRRRKEASTEPSPPPIKASAAEPLRHEASTEPPRLPWGIEPSAKQSALDPAPPGRISMMTARPYERANGNAESDDGAANAKADEGAADADGAVNANAKSNSATDVKADANGAANAEYKGAA